LITLSGFCKASYPKAIIYDNDTIIAITPDQLNEINILILQKEYCERRLELYKDRINQSIEDFTLLQDELKEISYKLEIIRENNDLLMEENDCLRRLHRNATLKNKIAVGVTVTITFLFAILASVG
jgi:hypothetical protein